MKTELIETLTKLSDHARATNMTYDPNSHMLVNSEDGEFMVHGLAIDCQCVECIIITIKHKLLLARTDNMLQDIHNQFGNPLVIEAKRQLEAEGE